MASKTPQVRKHQNEVEPKTRDKAEKILMEISRSSLVEDPESLRPSSVHMIEPRIYALSLLVGRALMRDPHSALLYDNIVNAIIQMQQDGSEVDLDSLMRLVEGAYVDGKPVRFRVYTFLNCAFPDAPRELLFPDGTTAKREPLELYAEIKDYFQEPAHESGAKVFEYFINRSHLYSPYSYELEILSRRFSQSAIISDDCVLPFEQFRAVINFLSLHIIIGAHWFRPQNTMSTFFASPLTMAKLDDNWDKYFAFERSALFSPQLRSVAVPTGFWSQYEEVRLATSVLGESEKQYLMGLLTTFQKGLDASEESVSLLHFWQTIERAVTPLSSDFSGPQKRLVQKVRALIDLEHFDIEILEKLTSIRNSYAHSGQYPMNSGDRLPRLGRQYASRLINGILEALPTLGSLEALDAYIEIGGAKSPTRRNAFRKAVDFALAKNQ